MADPMKRVEAIDFTKGILVFFMVIYHSLNAYGIFPYRYLPFVSLGFIMISGFLITRIYFPRYDQGMNRARSRLAVRAMKLVLIFTALNIVGRTAWPLHDSGIVFEITNFFGNWVDIYLVGSPYQVAFDVLLPISYTLLLAILVPNVPSIRRHPITACSISVIGVCVLIWCFGNAVYTIRLIGVGMIGIALGLLPLEPVNKLRSPPAIIALFMFYGLCSFTIGNSYGGQVVSTVAALLAFYCFGNTTVSYWHSRQIMLLGRYSLLSYILQIAYLRIVMSLVHKRVIEIPNLATMVVMIMLATYLTILILDHIRPKFVRVNLFYKVIFA
jgi:peptidoglycan/LPS O-acetylase OafA/YrhL